MAGILILYKKKTMKKIFFILIIGLMFHACSSTKTTTTSNSSVEKPTPTSLNGNWELQLLFASDNNWTKQPSINLNLASKTFIGNSGCNNLTGSFTVTGNYFAFNKNIGQTKMACPGNYERNFVDALLKVTSYSLNKDELELKQGEIVLMKYKRAK